MAALSKRQRNTRSRAAKRGWETRRQKERERAAKRALAAKKAAATRKKNAELREKKRLAQKRQRQRRLARDRAAAALETFHRAVDIKARNRELQAIKRSWRREKAALENAYGDDYERYLEILEGLADAEGVDWDIAYGSTESAA